MQDSPEACATFTVQVVFALAERAICRQVAVAPGTSIGEAVAASGIALELGLDLTRLRVGVFGRLRRTSDPASEGDRIEIYRPLVVDPNAARLRRAATKAARR